MASALAQRRHDPQHVAVALAHRLERGADSTTSIGTVGAWDSTTAGCPTSATTAAARSST
jgi:hypothetical protein